MTQLLMWDTPAKKMNTEEWKDSYGFEDGPTGGYVPNMSAEDAARWKAKLVGKTTGTPQVEIRRSIGQYQLLLIVSLGGGYKYKWYTREQSTGVNVHLSANGPIQMSFQDVQDMHTVVQEAKQFLESQLTSAKE